MNRLLRSHAAQLGSVLFAFLLWSTGPTVAQAYAPIDDLVDSVNQLLQSQQILNETVAHDLINSLQTISTMVDQGNKAVANDLLTAFTQDVNSLSGDLITPSAAAQLVQKAAQTQAGL